MSEIERMGTEREEEARPAVAPYLETGIQVGQNGKIGCD